MSNASRRLALRDFLKHCRSRIRPEEVGLASTGHRRVAWLRREEVAGLAGISPPWYTMLETGRYRRVSPQLIHRISTVLCLSDAEKSYLFSLAIDEFPGVPMTALRAESYDAIDAFQSLRWLSKRLWVATSGEEALETAREYAMNQLRSDVLATRTRLPNGAWTYAAIGDDDSLGDKVMREFSARWGDAFVDEIHCVNKMILPGEFLTRAEQEARSPDVGSKRREALDAVGWHQKSWAMASIQSRGGFVSRLVAFYCTEHAYSIVERAHLTATADLTSLALST